MINLVLLIIGLGTSETLLLLLLIIVTLFLGRGRLKKAIGVLFILIGFLASGMGIALMANVATNTSSYEGQLRGEFSNSYRRELNEKKTVGTIAIAGGLVFFIVGIVMVVSKSKEQIKNEVELEVIKDIQKNKSNQPITDDPIKTETKSTDDKFAQLEKLGKLKEQGLLTDEEFQQEKRKILS